MAKTLTYSLTIKDIVEANARFGQHYFDPETMRFFNSTVEPYVYQGPAGTFFITSEKYDASTPRKWTVRQFDPSCGRCSTAAGCEFNSLNKFDAQVLAAKLAEG